MRAPIDRLRFGRRLRRVATLARTLRASGALASPATLIRYLRHRVPLRRLVRALFGFRYSTGILLGHEVGLFTALATRDLTVDATADAVGVHPRTAEALLLILESEGAVERRGDRFALSPFGRDYLAPAGRDTVAPLLGLMGANARAFGEIVDGLRSGVPPKTLDIFSTEGRYEDFLDAVNAYLLPAARDFVRRCPLPAIHDFIAGSMGVSFSSVLLERQPSARVTYGCLAHLVREIPRLRERYGVPPDRVAGMHVHGGDPSQDRWGDERFDLVFLTKKMILAPEDRIGERFATKAFEVLRPGGVAVFWECIYPDAGRAPLGLAMEGVLDLAASPRVPVLTEHRMRKLLGRIGFGRVEDVVPLLTGELTFVVAYKDR